MVKKLQKTSAAQKTGPQRSSAVKDSAQQIWLAGLGAFSKAQKEGGKVFDTLVKEGLAIQRKTPRVRQFPAKNWSVTELNQGLTSGFWKVL